jgi:hypothetical protein
MESKEGGYITHTHTTLTLCHSHTVSLEEGCPAIFGLSVGSVGLGSVGLGSVGKKVDGWKPTGKGRWK